jgi:hydrogenase nickel incorporation protein HypA/HybF
MHELGIVASIVETCEARAEGRRVLRVVVAIGQLAAVVPDALRFAFDVATEGTLVEGAALEVTTIPAVGACAACGAEVPMPTGLGVCACGSFDLSLLRGDELLVKSMEVSTR